MATYGGGTNVTSFIVTANPTINNSGGLGTVVAYTTPIARTSKVRFISVSVPSGTNLTNATASIIFDADNGLGGWTTYATITVPSVVLNVGDSQAIPITGGTGQLTDGSFEMPYGTRIRVNGGSGAGGTARFQLSVTEYFSSN